MRCWAQAGASGGRSSRDVEAAGGDQPGALGLSFSDSTGLNVLLSARRQAEGAGVVMVLACMPQLLLQRFALTSADTVLRTYTTVAEAEASFAG
ncbi:hypothetical protein C1I97_12410 [Streptomyces sp. NTH33]|nr:hypothetical protein C1I97_12410 [Streptomyces sp. NTH33]